MTERFDIAVIGGGIVGLATAWRILERWPALRLAVVEKEPEVARHQSGHNTGVLHAGIYYRPGSLRARLCREGKEAIERFASERGIPFRRCGKVIVAVEEEELPRLAALKERALANGVDGIEEIGPERLREIEPHVSGLRALHSPGTGVIDYRQVSLALAGEIRKLGGSILTGRRVEAIAEKGGERILRTTGGDLATRHLVSCAGLHSDHLAGMTGEPGDLRIIPFRGDYWLLRPESRHLVRALVNPVPDPRFPFLGVHFSRRLDGEVLVGPNAVLAFAREGYSLGTISPGDLSATLAWPGFRRLMREYFSTGIREMWLDLWKPAWVRVLRRYLPSLDGGMLAPGPSGVRAQAVTRAGELLDDFSFVEGPNVLHVRNAPSPGATASLAIGRHLAGKAGALFSWKT